MRGGEFIEQSTIASVGRVFELLEAMVAHPAGRSVSELSEALGLSKPVVSRLLWSLASVGYVRQDAGSKRFHVTFGLVGLALRHLDALGLVEAVQPVLQALADETGELVQLAVVQGERMYYVAKAHGKKPLRIASMLGRQAPLHATAAGKLWLASLGDSEARALMQAQDGGFRAYTARTKTGWADLLADVEAARQSGYALSWGEINRDIVGVAVPVPDARGRFAAALVITLPEFYAVEPRIDALLAEARGAARKLSGLHCFAEWLLEDVKEGVS